MVHGDQTPAGIEVLEPVLDAGHEVVRHRTIDQAVIETEGEEPHRPDRNGIVDHDGALLDGADTEDRDLRLVDDRQAELRAEPAGVGDREGTVFHLVRLELLGPRAVGEIGDCAAQPEQVLLVRRLHDRDNQAPLEGDCDADVDVLLVDDPVVVSDALRTGTARRASTTAFVMKDMNVSFAPARSYAAFFCSRSCQTRW